MLQFCHVKCSLITFKHDHLAELCEKKKIKSNSKLVVQRMRIRAVGAQLTTVFFPLLPSFGRDKRGLGTAESVIPATYVTMATSGSPAIGTPFVDSPDAVRVYVCPRSPGSTGKMGSDKAVAQ